MLLLRCMFQGTHNPHKEADASKRALTQFNFPPHTFRHDFFVEMFCWLTYLVISYLRNMSCFCIPLSRSCQYSTIAIQFYIILALISCGGGGEMEELRNYKPFRYGIWTLFSIKKREVFIIIQILLKYSFYFIYWVFRWHF